MSIEHPGPCRRIGAFRCEHPLPAKGHSVHIDCKSAVLTGTSQHHSMPAILQVRKDGSDDYEASSEGDGLDEDEGESEAGGGYQDGEGDPCPNCGRIYK